MVKNQTGELEVYEEKIKGESFMRIRVREPVFGTKASIFLTRDEFLDFIDECHAALVKWLD